MTPEISDIADLDHEVATRLPLDVEGVVDAVGEFVLAIVDGEGEELRSAFDCVDVRKIVNDVLGISRGRGLQCRAPGIGE